MEPIDRAQLDAAVAICRRMGDSTKQLFGSANLEIFGKNDGTPVTEADYAAERLARKEISKTFPDDSIIGEEGAPKDGTSGRTWVLDPIDGTKAYVKGVPLYSSLLAVHDEHGPAIGVIHMPMLGETVYAGRGLGCFLNDDPAHVSQTDELYGSYVCTSGFGNWDPRHIAALVKSGVDLRTWGDGYGYAMVATGRIDGMLDPTVSLWDIAPMPVIMSEAGGNFTNIYGEPGFGPGIPEQYSAAASNGKIHFQLLDLMGL